MITVQNLLNAGSKAMNVNGTTPKTFSYSPGGSTTVQVQSLTCLLKEASTGNTAFTNFGALAALTNGILLQANIGGNTRTLATLNDNGDLATVFNTYNQFGSSAVLSILSVVTAEGFGNSTNVFVGSLVCTTPIVLVGTDSIQAVVQDNISAVSFLRMTVNVFLD